jgi:hypothetical protein
MGKNFKYIPIILILLFGLTVLLKSQKVYCNSLKVIYSQYDTIDNYQFIPIDALLDSNDMLIIGSEYVTKHITDKKSIEIFWPSTYIDGSYELVITPKQIYLVSIHENPNPNHLYWMTNINREQFELIKACLSSNKSKQLKDCTIEYSYRQSFRFVQFIEEVYMENGWTNSRYDNFAELMGLINICLRSANKLISIPNRVDFDNIKPLKMVIDRDG